MSTQHLLKAHTSEPNDEPSTEQEDNVLADTSSPASARSIWIYIVLVGAVLATFGGGLMMFKGGGGKPERMNVILMVSDGFGPASETFARDFYKHINGLDYLDRSGLPLDELLVGSSRTRSSSSLVTDSAAGATAFSAAQKSYNGAISVAAEGPHRPLGTVMEAAKAQGWMTGLVVTSRVTHATPACFYSHVVDRDMESEIAEFLVGDGPLGHVVDLALGGGRCFFLPNTTQGSCRTDSSNLLHSASRKGTHLLLNSTSYLSSISPKTGTLHLPAIGLFNRDHMNYDIDRVRLPESEAEPSLSEMSSVALKTLDRAAATDSKKGFLLLVEGSRIDMAAHSNDPANHARDILEYQETVTVVKKWIDALPKKQRDRTVMVSVSDHETGGLALARQLDPETYPEYRWLPEALVNVTHSTIFLAQQVVGRYLDKGSVDHDWLRSKIFLDGLGIKDATAEEAEMVLKEKGDAMRMERVLADMSSRRAEIGWSTKGHSGVDVNLYMHPRENDPTFRGSMDNTEIGAFITRWLTLDLDSITEKLNSNVEDWFHWRTTSKKEKGGQQKRGSKRSCDEDGLTHFHCGRH